MDKNISYRGSDNLLKRIYGRLKGPNDNIDNLLTIDALKYSGFKEGEILEVNQVVRYFNHVNRSVVGLDVKTNGAILGLSPNDSTDHKDWSHE